MMQEAPLLEHHLRSLRLPTILAHYRRLWPSIASHYRISPTLLRSKSGSGTKTAFATGSPPPDSRL